MLQTSDTLACAGDTWLTTSDVAHALRVCAETVRVWERSGRLPATRTLSGVRLFLARDVAQFQASRATATAGR